MTEDAAYQSVPAAYGPPEAILIAFGALCG